MSALSFLLSKTYQLLNVIFVRFEKESSDDKIYFYFTI